MGACATKLSGDQKVKGEPPLVVEDGVAPPVAEGEKANKADGVPAAAETTDPADVTRRRSLSDLLKEDEAGKEAVKVVTVDSVVATDDEAGEQADLSKEEEAAEATQQVAPEPSAVAVEQGATAEQLTDGHETGQELIIDPQAAEEEKRVDPDSVRVATAAAAAATAAALGAEGSEDAGGASA